jgi:hypothetical protein
MRMALACTCMLGCGFTPSATGDGGGSSIDAPPGSGSDSSVLSPAPEHLTNDDGQPGAMPLVLAGSVTIDTTNLTITGIATVMGEFDVRHQINGNSEVAVLHVSALTVMPNAQVRVIGSRPLIVVASGAIEAAGTLDASARGSTPGAGGSASGMGSGSGARGAHNGTYSDTGGGGAGFGNNGAVGGAVIGCGTTLDGAAAGASSGDDTISVFKGGAGGGAGESSACVDSLGGAGGGAIQLTSEVSVHIAATGIINAGGGGGAGGLDCGPSDGNSGAGGGAGGAIVLQAPMVSNEGVVAANGGGGGGGGSGGGQPADTGDAGQDGSASDNAAIGGFGIGGAGGDGGAGATRDDQPQHGTDKACGDNGGGGGGGVGRIAASAGYIESGTTSPQPIKTLPL